MNLLEFCSDKSPTGGATMKCRSGLCIHVFVRVFVLIEHVSTDLKIGNCLLQNDSLCIEDVCKFVETVNHEVPRCCDYCGI